MTEEIYDPYQVDAPVEPDDEVAIGRPRHEYTGANATLVESLSGYGIPHTDIAKKLEISPKTLRKHYRKALDNGMLTANTAVAQKLYQRIMKDGAQSASLMMFWMKTRAGWKETNKVEVAGGEGGPLVIQVSTAENAF